MVTRSPRCALLCGPESSTMNAFITIHSSVFHSQAKDIIYSINEYFLREKTNRAPLIADERGVLSIVMYFVQTLNKIQS